MPFIPLSNGIRVAMEFSLDGELVVNVYHFTRSTPIVSANLTAIAEIMVDMWAGDMLGVFSTDMSLVRVVATDISEADGIQIEYTTGLPLAGTSGNDAAPNNVAVVATYRTGFTGRSFRGRTYFAGIDETLIVNNTPAGGVITNILSSIDDMVTAANADGFNFVVASYRTGGAPRVAALGTFITDVTMDTRSDSQRRRLPAP